MSFNITELPGNVDASTRFERNDTFLYSSRRRRRLHLVRRRSTGSGTPAGRASRRSPAPPSPPRPASSAWSGSRTTATSCGASPWPKNADTLDLVPDQERLRASTLPALRRLRRTADPGNHVLLEPDDTPTPTSSAASAWTRQPAPLWDSTPPSARSCCPFRRRPALLGASSPSTPTAAASAAAATPAPAPGRLQRRSRHPDRPAAVPHRRRRHQPRHRHHPRGWRLQSPPSTSTANPVRLLRRRVRRADPALAGHPRAERAGVSRLHPAARLQGQLPRHGRRRLGPDLRALLHGRRIRPGRLPRRRLQLRGRAGKGVSTGRQRPPPERRLLAQHLRRQLRPRSRTRSRARRASTRRSTSPSRRSAASTR